MFYEARPARFERATTGSVGYCLSQQYHTVRHLYGPNVGHALPRLNDRRESLLMVRS
jgi:hypothetical protein